MYGVSILLFFGRLDVEVQFLAGDSLVNTEHVGRGSLEVRGGVVAGGHPEVFSDRVVDGLVEVGNLDKDFEAAT